jgi:hypothetical protein
MKFLRRRPWSRETKWIWNCTSIVHKLSLVGMQLYVKNIRRISTFQTKTLHPVTPDEGPSLETSKFSLYFSDICIPSNESLFILLTRPTLTQTLQDYITSIVRLHLSIREFLHYSCALIHLVSCVPWMRARRNSKPLIWTWGRMSSVL